MYLYPGRSYYAPYFDGRRFAYSYPCESVCYDSDCESDCDSVELLATKVMPSAAVLKATSMAPVIFTQQQIDDLTNYINNYRNIHQAPPIIWDPTIAVFSQNWANYLLKNHLFHHSGSSLYGENLAYLRGYGSDLVTLVKLSIDMWYNEYKLYDFSKPEFSEETGHFTALVWKSTTHFGLGFAINKKTKAAYITMNMSPPGNVIGEFDTNVLQATSAVTLSASTPKPTMLDEKNTNKPNTAKMAKMAKAANISASNETDTIKSLYKIINELTKINSSKL